MLFRSLGSHRVAAACAVALCSAASAATTNVIFSSVTNAPSNVVPTLGGPFSAFGYPFRNPSVSPNGSQWMIRAWSINNDALIIVGSGLSAAGAMTVAAQGLPTPFQPAGVFDSFRPSLGILDNGNFAYGTTLAGAPPSDQMIVLFDGVAQTPVIRSGTPSPIAGQSFGVLDSVHLLNDNTVRYRSTLSPGFIKQIIGSGSSVLAESSVTIPAGQLIAPPQPIRIFRPDMFSSSADGLHHIWLGTVNNPSDTNDVLVVDGTVVVQEGAPLPGGQFPGVNVAEPLVLTDYRPLCMSPNGTHWAFRTPMADGASHGAQTDIVLHNGSIVARTGAPIFEGSGERWDDVFLLDTFFMNVVNDGGDMVVGGTIAGSGFTNDVLVYYGADGSAFIVAQEGNPFDLNGNGVFDDNAYIGNFGTDSGVLTNSGQLYFTLQITTAGSLSIRGYAFVAVQVPEPSTMLQLVPLGALLLAPQLRPGVARRLVT